MKDLDFDELDRAVSSLLGANETGSDEETKGTEVSSEVAESVDTSDIVTTPGKEMSSDEPTEKKPLVERRPTGRFMDVMHSSSDMKSRPKPVTVSHKATTVAPLTSHDDENKADSNTAEGSTPIAPPDVEDNVPRDANDASDADQHTFPDPLDFHNFSMEDTGEPALVESSEQEAEDEQSDHDLALDKMANELNGIDGLIAKDEEAVSVDTPFLNGSTIEKRPLGAFSVNTEDTDVSLLSVEEAPEEPAEEVSDVLVENDTSPNIEAAIEEEVDEGVRGDVLVERDAQTLLDADVVPEELKGDIVAVEASPVESTTASSLAGGSIQPQYTEKVQSTDSEPTPVFDTTQYHQPLKHAPKQKSGWLGVVLIILFIVAGIGVGAAMYFLDPFGLQ
ncbi:MAG TPA: hypothetical protein PKD28_04160 [Candidatus Saccharibacteria bacterium]|nr:hypothetical protein [Candidatus Saccharibacteria bacterium]